MDTDLLSTSPLKMSRSAAGLILVLLFLLLWKQKRLNLGHASRDLEKICAVLCAFVRRCETILSSTACSNNTWLHPITNSFTCVRVKISSFLKCKGVTLPYSQVLFVLGHWLIRLVIRVALIGLIKAALSLLTVPSILNPHLICSKLPSEELFEIKDTIEKKILSWQILLFQPVMETANVLFSVLLFFFFHLCQSLCLSVSQRVKKKTRREKGGIEEWVSSVSWSDCTAKSGYTTKVSRSDCQ